MTVPAISTDDLDPLLHQAAHGSDLQTREAAVAAIGALDREATTPRVAAALTDANGNVRKAAALALGALGGDAAARALRDALESEQAEFVRRAIVDALQRIGGAVAIDALGEALADDQAKVQGAAATALGQLGAGADALVAAFAEPRPRWVRDQIALALGRVGGAQAIAALEAELTGGTAPETRAAALRALVDAHGAEALPRLGEVAVDDADAKVRRRAVQLAATFGAPATELLAGVLVADPDSRVTAAAAEALTPFTDGPRKVAAVVGAIERRAPARGELNPGEIVAALSAERFGDDATLTEALIRSARGCPDSIRGVLAELIIASADGSVARAGEVLNAFEAATGLAPGEFEPLRIEVGGATALDPLLRLMQSNLQLYFQEPIFQLNEDTRSSWLQTMDAARTGFRWRMRMSVAVFVVGMVLLVVSSAKFLVGDLSGEDAWGAGVPFAAGLASVLLTVYTGPLKDIRQSVRDLSAASAAFIGYIHTVLQISHTFSSLYLHEKMTFKEMAESSALIQAALTSTIESLENSPPDTDGG